MFAWNKPCVRVMVPVPEPTVSLLQPTFFAAMDINEYSVAIEVIDEERSEVGVLKSNNFPTVPVLVRKPKDGTPEISTRALPLLLEVVSLRRSSEMCQHREFKVEFKFPCNAVNSATKPKDVLPAIVVCVKVVHFFG